MRTKTRLGAKEVLLSEVFLARRDERLCRALVSRLRTSLRADYVVAAARHGSFLEHALLRSGFLRVPRAGLAMAFENRFLRLRESQKPRRLVVLPLSTSLPVDPVRLDNWDLSVGDLEF